METMYKYSIFVFGYSIPIRVFISHGPWVLWKGHTPKRDERAGNHDLKFATDSTFRVCVATPAKANICATDDGRLRSPGLLHLRRQMPATSDPHRSSSQNEQTKNCRVCKYIMRSTQTFHVLQKIRSRDGDQTVKLLQFPLLRKTTYIRNERTKKVIVTGSGLLI